MLFGIVVKTDMKKSQPIATEGSPVQIREGGLFLSHQREGEKMKEFDSFMNLTGKDRELQCRYHGTSNLRLEGRILSESDDGLMVGVSLWNDDIASQNYDHNRNSLDIWYQSPPPNTIRHTGLVLARFNVPEDIKEINVYDAGQNP